MKATIFCFLVISTVGLFVAVFLLRQSVSKLKRSTSELSGLAEKKGFKTSKKKILDLAREQHQFVNTDRSGHLLNEIEQATKDWLIKLRVFIALLFIVGIGSGLYGMYF